MSANGAELAVAGTTLCAGQACGNLLVLAEPLSFWGGTDRTTGRIIDTHHPQHGALLAGSVVLMDASRGSSSSSSVLAEQLRAGVGPAAILLTGRDAIVALGALAAAELYGTHMPIILLDAEVAAQVRGFAESTPNGAGVLKPRQLRASVNAGVDGRAGAVFFRLAALTPTGPEPTDKGFP